MTGLLTLTMADALAVIREGGVTYTYRPFPRSVNRPIPVTPADLTPAYSHELSAATVTALEVRGLVTLSPVTEIHGKVRALVSADDTPATPKPAGRVTWSDMKIYPEYYGSGEGSEAAEASRCSHGYRRTDSCPNCP